MRVMMMVVKVLHYCTRVDLEADPAERLLVLDSSLQLYKHLHKAKYWGVVYVNG